MASDAPAIDTNQWYYLYVNEDKRMALIGTNLYTGSGTKGAIFFNVTDTSANTQRWQIFPTTVNGNRVYTLRCKEGGPNAFMGAGYVAAEELPSKTRPQMFRGDIVVDDGVYWSFSSWGDSTWAMTNGANGTKYNLNKKVNGLLAMDSDIQAPQNGQRWSIAPIAKIDDEKYSSINLRGAAASTSISSSSRSATASTSATSPASVSASSASSPTTSSTSTGLPPANDDSSGGLSTGAKAGIGAGAGVGILLLIVLGLIFWRKRKQLPAYAPPQELPHDSYNRQGPPLTKYEMYHDSAAKHEMSSVNPYEVPANEKPAELPGHAVPK